MTAPDGQRVLPDGRPSRIASLAGPSPFAGDANFPPGRALCLVKERLFQGYPKCPDEGLNRLKK